MGNVKDVKPLNANIFKTSPIVSTSVKKTMLETEAMLKMLELVFEEERA